MKFILGKKVEMSQLWKEDSRVVPVTTIQAGPCQVVQIKTKEKDGYSAVQLGFEKAKKINKPEAGHLKDLSSLKFLREVCTGEASQWKKGDILDVSQFNQGDIVKVTGVSKGRGFQGVVKRHHFHGHPTTHGHKDQARMPGSIGAGGVQHVRKGTRMAGRMGGELVTISNLKVIEIDKDKNLLYLKGAVPGGRGALLMIVAR